MHKMAVEKGLKSKERFWGFSKEKPLDLQSVVK